MDFRMLFRLFSASPIQRLFFVERLRSAASVSASPLERIVRRRLLDRILMLAIAPILDGLVVDDQRRLWQEADEALLKAEISGNRTSVLSATSTPKVDFCTFRVE
jgi:hypothetical protein